VPNVDQLLNYCGQLRLAKRLQLCTARVLFQDEQRETGAHLLSKLGDLGQRLVSQQAVLGLSRRPDFCRSGNPTSNTAWQRPIGQMCRLNWTVVLVDVYPDRVEVVEISPETK